MWNRALWLSAAVLSGMVVLGFGFGSAVADEGEHFAFVNNDGERSVLEPPQFSPVVPRIAEGTAGHDEAKGLERVTATEGFPWRSICHLTSWFEGNYYGTCTGFTFIDSFHVMTAAHCLYDGAHGGWADEVEVVCGMDGDDRPYGNAWGTSWSVASSWLAYQGSDERYNYDWGFVQLDRRKGDSTGRMGWYAVEDNNAWYEARTLNIAGYPGLYCDSECLYHDFADVFDANFYRVWTYHENHKGMSGGPVWWFNDDEQYVLAVYRGGYDSDDDKWNTADCVRLGFDLYWALVDAFDGHDTPRADFESDWCDGYNAFQSSRSICCQTHDPCGWANDGGCDCSDRCSWDSADCAGGGDDDDEPSDDDDDWCSGYTGSNPCCKKSDPCDWADDGFCDCSDTCSWDYSDCGGSGDDDDHPADDDDDWCAGYSGDSPCCQTSDPCDWAGDGFCDCNGDCSWDSGDCSSGGDGDGDGDGDGGTYDDDDGDDDGDDDDDDDDGMGACGI